MLLQQDEDDADNETCCHSGEGDQPAFENEYSFDETGSGAHAAKSRDVSFFFDDEHGEGAEDVGRR